MRVDLEQTFASRLRVIAMGLAHRGREFAGVVRQLREIIAELEACE
jgi:hypothetical protein